MRPTSEEVSNFLRELLFDSISGSGRAIFQYEQNVKEKRNKLVS